MTKHTEYRGYQARCLDSSADAVIKAFLLEENSTAPITDEDIERKTAELNINDLTESCQRYIAKIINEERESVDTICENLKSELNHRRAKATETETRSRRIEYNKVPETILLPLKQQNISDIKPIAQALYINMPEGDQMNEDFWNTFIPKAYEFYQEDDTMKACLSIPNLEENEEEWKKIKARPKNKIITKFTYSYHKYGWETKKKLPFYS